MSPPSLSPSRFWRLLRGADGSLRQKLVSGSTWHLGVTAYNSALLLAQALLSTHCLRDPREFGLVNSVMWAYTLGEVFTTSGLSLAITQHRGDATRLLGPVWTVQAVRGVVLGLCVGLIGEAMSLYYGEPRIAPLAWTAALSAPLNGLAGLGPLLALRELGFRRAALFQALETTLGAAAGMVLIATLRTAWAIPLGLNVMALARIISSYWMRPTPPRLDFRWGPLLPFAGFARSAFLCAVLAFLNERGDDLVVGTLLGMEGLGLYHVAFLYANLPGLKVAQVLGNLLVPTFSHLREDRERFRQAFVRFIRVTMGLAAVLFAPLAALAPQLFAAISGGRFLPAVPAFRVLCLFGALRFFQFSADAALVALGEPRYLSRAQLAQFLAMGTLVIPLTAHWGTVGAARAVAAGSLLSALYAAWALSRLLAPRGAPPAPPAVRPPAAPREARRALEAAASPGLRSRMACRR